MSATLSVVVTLSPLATFATVLRDKSVESMPVGRLMSATVTLPRVRGSIATFATVLRDKSVESMPVGSVRDLSVVVTLPRVRGSIATVATVLRDKSVESMPVGRSNCYESMRNIKVKLHPSAGSSSPSLQKDGP